MFYVSLYQKRQSSLAESQHPCSISRELYILGLTNINMYNLDIYPHRHIHITFNNSVQNKYWMKLVLPHVVMGIPNTYVFLLESRFFCHTIYPSHNFASLHSSQLPTLPALFLRSTSRLFPFQNRASLWEMTVQHDKARHNK